MSLDNIISIEYDAHATAKEYTASYPNVTKAVGPCQFHMHSSTLHLIYIYLKIN